MRGKIFLVLLLTMILLTAVVSAAEETSDDAMGIETVDETAVIAETDADFKALLSEEQAITFGGIHYTILMMTEEAFDYLLTGDEDQKQTFLDEYASLAGDYAAFENAMDLSSNETAEFRILYDDLNIATEAMGTTADAMFASYEANRAVDLDDVIAFEDAVDNATSIVDTIWLQNSMDSMVPINEVFARGQLNTLLLEAIEESYAYPLLGDEIEKEDALKKFAEFDELLKTAREMNPDVSFDDIERVKSEIMAAAENFFATYETEGSVTADDVAELEIVVEPFNEFIEQLRTISTGQEEVAMVTLIEEETAVNATS